MFYPSCKCDCLWTIRQLAGRRLAPFAPGVYVGVGKSCWKYKTRGVGGGRGGDHAVCVLCYDGGGVWHEGIKKKKRVLEGVSGEWGLLKNLRQECVYLTRPAPTHPWPPSQFPGWGPDLGDVSPLSWGFCRSHYHLTPWGVLKRNGVKVWFTLNKHSTTFPTNRSMRKNKCHLRTFVCG